MRPGRAAARRPWPAFLLAVAMLAGGPAHGADDPPIPEFSGYVNDHAGVMAEGDRAKLESFLDQVQRKTGAEFAVLTVKSTAPLAMSEYKVRVFERWGIGKRDEDTGLLLVVAVDDREARFETGYGLEGTLPDGFQSRMFRREMAPRFREGDYAGGITQGMLACAARLAAEKKVALEWNGAELRYDGGRRDIAFPVLVAIILAVFVLLTILIAAGAMGRAARGWRPRTGGFGGNWSSFGGGWSGGGWGGGGGGGGGGSFGGFGGGSSGGGGGGGSW